MKGQIFALLLAFLGLFSHGFAQKAALAKLTPLQAAIIVQATLRTEGHPCTVKREQDRDKNWNFRVFLENKYNYETLGRFLSTLVGAVSQVTRYTPWKSERVTLMMFDQEFAYITTDSCRKLADQAKRGMSDDVYLVSLFKELHLLAKRK